MDKKPRKMDFAEYTCEVQHTHTWYYPDEVLPPENENVIVETKETLSYQCAFYVDPEDIFLKENISGNVIFIDEKNKIHTKDTVPSGFYVELPLGGEYERLKKITVIRWTDCPSIGIGAGYMNVIHALRQYLRQAGRTEETSKKIMRGIEEVFAEKAVNWEELKDDKS